MYLVEDDEDTYDDEHSIGMVTYHIGSLTAKDRESSKVPKQLFATMTANDKAKVKFQLECGATCNLLPQKKYTHAMGNLDELYLKKSNATLTMYNGNVMHPVGKCKLNYTRGSCPYILEFQVVDGDVKPFLCAESCQKLQFLKVLVNDSLNHRVDAVAQDFQPDNPVFKPKFNSTYILKEYADVFEGLGLLEGHYLIEIGPTVKPVVHPPRRVPVTLNELLKK